VILILIYRISISIFPRCETPHSRSDNSPSEMGSINPSPPKRVAVIGAGVSGITTAKHLKDVGINAVVFERSSRIGGNWLYDARRPVEPSYPSLRASLADPWTSKSHINKVKDDDWNSDDELRFAPPG
jgi:hypothetical protein